ncbi:MAG: hypothetical protein HOA30_11730 [Rhodospirillaceae bacterium]|jgi:hypothetical protein|nr:hypothetical protein [Rhodospirillaceae bacterium]MBT5296771.1 hypothetical protein [Rhodospirillaceae bacterium]MBT5514838.1 hypothetical protein [Rhodospirillaceae bacterium]MBT6087543.1 hypothetical protein [Rhodospirillaceae bacterium]MBT6884705.1 hypothetical protein [Rhodospirillaceae bacterium]
MKYILSAVAVAFALAVTAPAHAFHCPADMKKIDAALAKNPQMSKKDMAKITGLGAKGEAMHKAGQHGKSVAALAKAMEALGIK